MTAIFDEIRQFGDKIVKLVQSAFRKRSESHLKEYGRFTDLLFDMLDALKVSDEEAIKSMAILNGLPTDHSPDDFLKRVENL